MTRAPHITNQTLSRRRYHLRAHHFALIEWSTRQKVMPPTKDRAYLPNAFKVEPALSLTGRVQTVCQTGSKASPPLKSP